MTLDAYVKMVTCECGYFRGDETFDVHAASSLQEFSEKNMKYYSVHHDIKNKYFQKKKYLQNISLVYL